MKKVITIIDQKIKIHAKFASIYCTPLKHLYMKANDKKSFIQIG